MHQTTDSRLISQKAATSARADLQTSVHGAIAILAFRCSESFAGLDAESAFVTSALSKNFFRSSRRRSRSFSRWRLRLFAFALSPLMNDTLPPHPNHDRVRPFYSASSARNVVQRFTSWSLGCALRSPSSAEFC